MATNYEMIYELAMMVGYEYDGSNLKTFAEWKKEGYMVRKGEKACMKLELWKPFTAKVLDENGKQEMDENGKPKTETRFKLVPSSLFSIEQVDKKGEPVKKAEIVEMTVEVEVKEEAKEVEEVKPQTKREEAAELVEAVKAELTIKQDVPTELDVHTAWFSRKPSTAREVMKKEFAECDRYVVFETVELPELDFYTLSENLLSDNDLFEDFKGGHDSVNELDVPEGTNWWELTEKQQNYFSAGAYRCCMKVTCKSSTFSLLIDPQGYNYARYVAIEGI